MDFGDVIGYGVAPKPDFWLGPQMTGSGFRESHIAFAAPDRAAGREFFRFAVDTGVEVLHPPGSGRSITLTSSGPSCATRTKQCRGGLSHPGVGSPEARRTRQHQRPSGPPRASLIRTASGAFDVRHFAAPARCHLPPRGRWPGNEEIAT